MRFGVKEDINSSNRDNKAIFYSHWNGQEWTNPIAVLHSPNAGAANPEVSIDLNGDLVIVWNTGLQGPLYFSRVSADRAGSISEWLEPIEITPRQSVASSHNMYIDRFGKIYLAYTIPFNEERGIYLTESEDDGSSWSTPSRIFSGSNAGWEMVGNVHITQTRDNHLHVFWEQATLSEANKAVGLYYARSEDGGDTWSESEVVLDAIIDWSYIFTTDEDSLLRIWQEDSSNSKEIKYQVSNDDGLSWENSESVSILSEAIDETSVIGDRSGQLHIFNISSPFQDTLVLRQMNWDGSQWRKANDYQIDQNFTNGVNVMAAAISQEGRIGLIYTGMLSNQIRDDRLGSMFFITRDIVLADPVPTQPQQTPTTTFTPTPSVILTAFPTMEVSLPTGELNSDGPLPPIPMGISIYGLMIGVGIAVLLAGVVFGFNVFVKLISRR